MVSIKENNDMLIDLEGIKLDYSLMKLIPRNMMVKHCFIPLYIRENSLYIAVCETEDKQLLKDIGFITKKNLIVYISKRDQIQNALGHMDKVQDTNLILEQLKAQYEKLIKKDSLINMGLNMSDSSPIIKLANIIIEQGINLKASDIHMEPMEDIVRIRYRIDGYLVEQLKLPKEVYSSVCSRIKLQANMDIAEKRLPQDGKIIFHDEKGGKDLRVSTLPSLYGEKIVIRILYKNNKLLSLNTLGFFTSDETIIEDILRSAHGIILVTGPTGSGKTTTLYSMLNSVNYKYNNIVTIEDPIEISLKGINQVNVNSKVGLNFANGLRSILRQDPDIIMLGEIRDEETAEIAVRAAITGHLVIATLHTNDSASSVSRLIDMGVPSYLLADSLIACVAQRLVRKICNFCKVAYEPSMEEKMDLELKTDDLLYEGCGCVFCNNTGYKERIIAYEIMRTNQQVRELIGSCRNVDEIRRLNEKLGMKPLKENCRALVRQGTTTYKEYIKICSSNF